MFEHKQIIPYLAQREAGVLNAAETEAVRVHLLECATCREHERAFVYSMTKLRNASSDLVPANMVTRVLAQIDQPKSSWIRWRASWIGAAVMTTVVAFSIMMTHTSMDNQQVIQAYSEDLESVWEGGGTNSYDTWLQDSWSQTTWLEQSETTQSESN